MKTLKLLSAIGIIALILSGCKGDTGPAGPAGPAGANGTSGLTSTTYTVTAGNWVTLNANNWSYTTSTSIPGTDQVTVYLSADNQKFTCLPVANFFNVGDNLYFVYGTGLDIILYYYSQAAIPIGYTIYFKIMSIPPSVIKQHPNTNWHDYEQVNAILQAQNTVAQ